MKASDKLKVQELLSRAAYCFDERKLDGLAECFTSNATMLVRIAGVGDVGPFKGRDAIMKLMSDTLESQDDVRRHVISNFFFEAEDKKAATVVSSLVVCSVARGKINVIISGIYRDEVVRKAGVWRICNRRLDLDLPF
ncbi:MAG TPA: nuclear transport factor 2 family protein [Xanthomonadales bacterium]|nr:nuclear transport factor 2 family protein [Xanthomonadales bacterium]